MEMLLDSWDRQAGIIQSLAGLVTNSNRGVASSESGWRLDVHFAHIHAVRMYWLSQVNPTLATDLKSTLINSWDHSGTTSELSEICLQLEKSALAIRAATKHGLEVGGQFGPYDNVVLFLQHMVWHEGYHAGLIILALRNTGEEPEEAWTETHIWEPWRGPEVWQ